MQLTLDPADLRPIVETVVAETLAAAERSGLEPERLAYPEAEAAQLLGIASHQLRDARHRGEITATKVGGRIGYERSELVAYLRSNRQEVA